MFDRKRIDVYEQGSEKLRKAYEGISQAELQWTPPDGSWTLQKIAVHLMDSDLIGGDRMKRIASMPIPLLVGFDETAFANLPGSDLLSAETAIEQFCLNRGMVTTLLRHLPDDAFERFGIHTEGGKVTLSEMLENYIHHLEHHLKFVAKKRKLFAAQTA
ncbi:DinB family protein [Pirellulaceae bacterium SH501]